MGKLTPTDVVGLPLTVTGTMLVCADGVGGISRAVAEVASWPGTVAEVTCWLLACILVLSARMAAERPTDFFVKGLVTSQRPIVPLGMEARVQWVEGC